MISLKQSSRISEYLDNLIKNPKPELNYNNEFELLIAVVLSAQTTDIAVNKVTNVLFQKYPNARFLASASINDIEKIIKTIGLYHNKASYLIQIARIIEDKKSIPHTREELMELPGVGRKTANVILSNLNIEPAIAVDTHVERVSKRLYIADINDSVLEVEKKLMKTFKDKTTWNKLHHQLILFGRYYCKAKNPSCNQCGLTDICRFYHINNEKKK